MERGLSLALVALAAPALGAIGNRVPDLCITTGGERCIFPFTYKGVEHLECSYTDSSTPWCATMVDFTGSVVTNRWGDCEATAGSSCTSVRLPTPTSCTTTGGPSSGRPCVFPFRYNGVTYSSCAPPVASVTQAWCSTATFPNGTHISGAGMYGTCPSSCTSASETGTVSSGTSGSSVPEVCSPSTTWTTACGQTCVCGARGAPVCTACPATTTAYYPPAATTPTACTAVSGPGAGRPCTFPFTWAGATYTSCAEWTYGGAGQGSTWCSTQTDSQGNHMNGSGNYGFCPTSCRPGVSTRPGIAEVNQRSRLRGAGAGGAVVFGGRAGGGRPT